MEVKTIEELVYDIDMTLAQFEDWMHNKESKECSIARKKLKKLYELINKPNKD